MTVNGNTFKAKSLSNLIENSGRVSIEATEKSATIEMKNPGSVLAIW